ncbi:MAG: hypothetical protein WCG25_09605 [bacterium]
MLLGSLNSYHDTGLIRLSSSKIRLYPTNAVFNVTLSIVQFFVFAVIKSFILLFDKKVIFSVDVASLSIQFFSPANALLV